MLGVKPAQQRRSRRKPARPFIISTWRCIERSRVHQVKPQKAIPSEAMIAQATLDAIGMAILAVDARGAVAHYNRAFLDLWNLSESDLVALSHDDLLVHMSRLASNPDAFLARARSIGRSKERESID
jgi:PAS domain-containing protein